MLRENSINFQPLPATANASINAQSISPAQATEICPITEYTFPVTIPAAYSSIVFYNKSKNDVTGFNLIREETEN